MPWTEESTTTNPNWSLLSVIERRALNKVDFQIRVTSQPFSINSEGWFVRADRPVTIAHFIQEP